MQGDVGIAVNFDFYRTQVNQNLSACAERLATRSERLGEASKYVLEGGGKRLRALLAFSIFRDLSRQDEVSTELLACATAVEVVHAASLVHDDLPALDNDDFRRGRPACHKAFGEATAVLVGDVLIGEAFSLVVESVTSAEQSVVLVRYLAGTWEKLCAGQQLDLDKSTEGVLIAELKTGALFGFSAACGAICAAINPDDLLAVYDWGVRVGVAFQKLDDIEDGERSRDEKEVVANDFRTLADEISDLLGVETPNTLAVLELIIPVG